MDNFRRMSEKGCPCLSRSLPPSVRYSSGCEVSPLSSVREEGKDPNIALSPDPGGGGSVRRDSTGFPERGEFLCPAVHGGPLKIRSPDRPGRPEKLLSSQSVIIYQRKKLALTGRALPSRFSDPGNRTPGPARRFPASRGRDCPPPRRSRGCPSSRRSLPR